MLRVGIHEAKAGMVLALPIFHPRRAGTTLLRPGIALDDRAIDRLQGLSIREVWIRFPGATFVAQYISPKVFAAQQQLAWTLASAFDAVSGDAGGALDYAAYRRSVAGLLDKLVADPRAAIFVQEIAGRPLMRHSGTVCFLSMLMGLRLEAYMICERARLSTAHARDVSSLGVGAMMHDIGMLRLDDETLHRWERTRDESDPAFRRHVQIGFDLVKGAVGPSAAAAILHHHQRFDGSGFPARRTLDGKEEPLAGSDIHVFARIIAVADLFDRHRHPIGRARAPIVRALRAMLDPPTRGLVDPIVVKALLSVVPAYAPGSLVKLSDGRRGVVIEWTADNPCRPVVQIIDAITAEIGSRYDEGERVDLRERTDLAVTGAEGQDVAADNFYPSYEGEFNVNIAERAMMNAAGGPAPRAA